MSAEVRQALAAAVNTVEGMHCSAYYVQTTTAGNAMVRLDRMRRDDSGFGFMNTWQVLVILPSGIAAAEKYLEEKLPLLLPAVGEEMVVTTVTPSELVLDNGSRIPCVAIEGARGH